MRVSAWTRALALAAAAFTLVAVDATPVSVCRDATYEVPAARGAVCSGAGAAPAGKACPLKGDAATQSCHPYLPSFDGKACVAKEDAVCDIVNGNTWGCVFPSVGCVKAKPAPTPAPTTRAPVAPVVVVEVTCPTWAYDDTVDDVDTVQPAIFIDEPEASNPVFAEIFKTETKSWYTKESPVSDVFACNERPTPAPSTAPPTTAPPTTAPPTVPPTSPAPTSPAPTTTAPPPTTPAPTTTAPPPTTPAPTTTAPPPTTPAPTTTAPPTTTPAPTTTAPPTTTPPPTTPAPTTPEPVTPEPTTTTPCPTFTPPPATTLAPVPTTAAPTTRPPDDYGPSPSTTVTVTTSAPTTPGPAVVDGTAEPTPTPASTTTTPAPTTEVPAERPAPTTRAPAVDPSIATTAPPDTLSSSRAGDGEPVAAGITTFSSADGISTESTTPGMGLWGPVGVLVVVAVAVGAFAVRKNLMARERAAPDGYDGVTMLTPA